MITKKEVLEAAREAEEQCHQWWNSIEVLAHRKYVLREEEEEVGSVDAAFRFYFETGQVTAHCTYEYSKRCLENGWLTGWAEERAEALVREHLPVGAIIIGGKARPIYYHTCPNCGHDDLRCECM